MILTAATIFLVLAIILAILAGLRVPAAVGFMELAWASFFLAILFGLR